MGDCLASLQLTSGGDPKTGTFYQMRTTVGDTVCSMNGIGEIYTKEVLDNYISSTSEMTH